MTILVDYRMKFEKIMEKYICSSRKRDDLTFQTYQVARILEFYFAISGLPNFAFKFLRAMSNAVKTVTCQDMSLCLFLSFEQQKLVTDMKCVFSGRVTKSPSDKIPLWYKSSPNTASHSNRCLWLGRLGFPNI